jgi:hypothetical protein
MADPRGSRVDGITISRGVGHELDSHTLPDFPSMRVSLLRKKPAIGTLQAYVEAQLASPAGAKGTPYEYDVDYADPAGTIPPQHYTVAPDSPATIRQDFYQSVPSTGAWGTAGGFLVQILTPEYLLPRPNSGSLVQYLSAGPGLVWRSVYVGFHYAYGGQVGAFQQYAAREHETQAWGEFPLHRSKRQ